MKFQKIFLIFILISFITITKAQKVRIISDFETGSIGSLKEVTQNRFKGQTMHWIKQDQIGNQYYWFYFQVINVKDKTITFDLDNLIGIYRGNPHNVYTEYTQPVISYNNETWERITEVSFNEETKSFSFSKYFTKDTAWIAYAHPNTVSRCVRYIESIKENKYVTIKSIGNSFEKRVIPLVEITDKSFPEENKKRVLIIAMQHPGEDAGSFVANGVIDYILSSKEGAADLRKNFTFHVIPMMNPDGTFHGTSRYSSRMQDLNDEWIQDETKSPETPIEVQIVKNWIANIYDSNRKIDLFLDFHCHTQKGNTHAILDGSENGDIKKLVDSIDNKWNTIYSNRANTHNSSTNFMRNTYSVPSGTLELSQSYLNIRPGHYLTIDDYKSYGEDIAKAVGNYFK